MPTIELWPGGPTVELPSSPGRERIEIIPGVFQELYFGDSRGQFSQGVEERLTYPERAEAQSSRRRMMGDEEYYPGLTDEDASAVERSGYNRLMDNPVGGVTEFIANMVTEIGGGFAGAVRGATKAGMAPRGGRSEPFMEGFEEGYESVPKYPIQGATGQRYKKNIEEAYVREIQEEWGDEFLGRLVDEGKLSPDWATALRMWPDAAMAFLGFKIKDIPAFMRETNAKVSRYKFDRWLAKEEAAMAKEGLYWSQRTGRYEPSLSGDYMPGPKSQGSTLRLPAPEIEVTEHAMPVRPRPPGPPVVEHALPQRNSLAVGPGAAQRGGPKPLDDHIKSLGPKDQVKLSPMADKRTADEVMAKGVMSPEGTPMDVAQQNTRNAIAEWHDWTAKKLGYKNGEEYSAVLRAEDKQYEIFTTNPERMKAALDGDPVSIEGTGLRAKKLEETPYITKEERLAVPMRQRIPLMDANKARIEGDIATAILLKEFRSPISGNARGGAWDARQEQLLNMSRPELKAEIDRVFDTGPTSERAARRGMSVVDDTPTSGGLLGDLTPDVKNALVKPLGQLKIAKSQRGGPGNPSSKAADEWVSKNEFTYEVFEDLSRAEKKWAIEKFGENDALKMEYPRLKKTGNLYVSDEAPGWSSELSPGSPQRNSLAIGPGTKQRGGPAHHGSRASRYDVVPKGEMTDNIRDLFDMKYVGDATKGEGNTAYGWGLYFAESPGVATNYKSKLSINQFYLNKRSSSNADLMDELRTIDPDRAKKVEQQLIQKYDRSGGKGLNKGPNYLVDPVVHDKVQNRLVHELAERTQFGHLYEVDIPDETIARMLDWDAPLSEQPENVKTALANFELLQDLDVPNNPTGEQLYRAIAEEGGVLRQGEEAASKALNEAGIPGIRFFDGTSRQISGDAARQLASAKRDLQAAIDSGMSKTAIDNRRKVVDALTQDVEQGTRNIVVFNPDDIASVKRDGELVYDTGKKNALRKPLGQLKIAKSQRGGPKQTEEVAEKPKKPKGLIGHHLTTTAGRIRNKTMKEGGYTVDLDTGHVPDTGIMVGKFPNENSRTVVLDKKVTKQDLVDFAKANEKQLRRVETYLGTWKNNDQIYLDIAKRYPSNQLRRATKYGESTGQDAIYDLLLEKEHPVGNWKQFINSGEFTHRMLEMEAIGRKYLAAHGGEWWDIHKTLFETVYGAQNLHIVAGYIASTAPMSNPTSNVQVFSEYMRRHIIGEPVIQPNWRVPANAMKRKPGSQIGNEASRQRNLILSSKGQINELRRDKVNQEAQALMGNPDAQVLDRWWARAGEKPSEGIYTASKEGQMDRPNIAFEMNNYPIMTEVIRPVAGALKESPRNFTANVWTGMRETVRWTGELFGVKYSRRPQGESKGYKDIFEDLIEAKAKHVGMSKGAFMKELGKGNADLLSLLIATPFGAYLFEQLLSLAGESENENNLAAPLPGAAPKNGT